MRANRWTLPVGFLLLQFNGKGHSSRKVDLQRWREVSLLSKTDPGCGDDFGGFTAARITTIRASRNLKALSE